MFDHHKKAHEEVYGSKTHEKSWTHEVIAGAAAFAAMKHHEDGKADSKHKLTKEVFAAFAAAEADKLVETKGLDFIDRKKAQHSAKKHAEEIYDQRYS